MKDKFYLDDEALTYDDVLLVPSYSDVRSRLDVDISTQLPPLLECPIMSAAMDTITGKNMAEAMAEVGGLGVVHRFQSVEDRIKCINDVKGMSAVAVGMTEVYNDIARLIKSGVDVLALDVANAHTHEVIERTKWLRDVIEALFANTYLMVGNIVTGEAAIDLAVAGADIVKVGIGPGAVCTTRTVTGFGMPNVTAIMNVRESLKKNSLGFVSIVADGGIRGSGDISKAIAAGADAVMIGSLFAGTTESLGETVVHDGKLMRTYRGMASKESQIDWKNGLKRGTVAEGVSGVVETKGSVKEIVEELKGGLRSAFTYAGANNIKDFQEKTKFIKVTANCTNESRTRIKE